MKNEHPRKGAWAKVRADDGSELLAIITAVNDVDTLTPALIVAGADGAIVAKRKALKAGKRFADTVDVHYVFEDSSDERDDHEQHGHTAGMGINVPVDRIRQPTYEELQPTLVARKSDQGAHHAHRLGYVATHPDNVAAVAAGELELAETRERLRLEHEANVSKFNAAPAEGAELEAES